MKIKNIFALAAVALPMTAVAQTIQFESQDYQKLGVYDTWEASPFRTGVLKGNYGIVDNHLNAVNDELGKAPNGSKKMLAVQRSRFGSNTFGVRIDLKETFELTTQTRYLHVMVNRPYGGRVMVVGLGKRQDRAGQSAETEQFWAMSTKNVAADRWEDVVLPIKGNGGIDIYSLVVVPDCESPHLYTEDRICYIDNIEINDNPNPAFVYGYYPVNFDKEEINTRGDRYLMGAKLEGSKDGDQTVAIPGSKHYFYNLVNRETFTAKAGETVTPKITYHGNWMHGFVYADWDKNGKFKVAEDGSTGEGSELVSYSYFKGKNSKGESLSNANTLNTPSFQIPENLAPGYYRLRFKVDWDNIDAGGALTTDNSLTGNGGGIMDIRLNVHEDVCHVNDANRNGEVLTADGQKLVKFEAPFGQPFTIRMHPEKGFEYSGIIVKHGYRLSGDSIDHENVQWEKVHFERQQFNENHEFTIPGKYMDGDVEIEGLFIEEGTYVKPVKPSRYTTTSITNGAFADTTTWYTLQIGQDGYVLANNGKSKYIALNNTEIDITDPAQLWCFTGNDEDGFQLYNGEAGGKMVLASSTNMGSNAGGSTYPILYPVDKIPSGYVSVWRFMNSTDLGPASVEYAYMYQDGYEANKVNNRDKKLAFWNGGQDGGSTLQIRVAKKGTITGITNVETTAEASQVYDLNGRRVQNTDRGVYIVDGSAVYRK